MTEKPYLLEPRVSHVYTLNTELVLPPNYDQFLHACIRILADDLPPYEDQRDETGTTQPKVVLTGRIFYKNELPAAKQELGRIVRDTSISENLLYDHAKLGDLALNAIVSTAMGRVTASLNYRFPGRNDRFPLTFLKDGECSSTGFDVTVYVSPHLASDREVSISLTQSPNFSLYPPKESYAQFAHPQLRVELSSQIAPEGQLEDLIEKLEQGLANYYDFREKKVSSGVKILKGTS